MTLQKLPRWNPGSLSAITSALTLPNVVSDLCLMAERVGVSPRHFARLFHTEVGITPAAWVEMTRTAAARSLLENGNNTPKRVAAKCGFANVDTLRRTFMKHVGVTPAEYRKSQTHLLK